jgi:hypothetical protein
MEKGKFINEKMLKALTAEGFEELVFSLYPHYHQNYGKAFEAANELYFSTWDCYRYESYESYRVAKSKRDKHRLLTKLQKTV